MAFFLVLTVMFSFAGCQVPITQDAIDEKEALQGVFPNVQGIQGGHLNLYEEWSGSYIIYGYLELDAVAVQSLLETYQWRSATAKEIMELSGNTTSGLDEFGDDGKVSAFLNGLLNRDEKFYYCEAYAQKSMCFLELTCYFPFHILSVDGNVLYVYENAIRPDLVGEWRGKTVERLHVT